MDQLLITAWSLRMTESEGTRGLTRREIGHRLVMSGGTVIVNDCVGAYFSQSYST